MSIDKNESMLEIINLNKKIKNKMVLKNINLKFSKGIYGLLGPNGAGKTTLLRCIMKLYPKSEGTIIYKTEKGKKENRDGYNIGYLPQTFGAFKELTVTEILYYFAYLKDLNPKYLSEQVEDVLEMVNLKEQMNNKVKSLSGGMVRRLGIAQALLGNPEILLFDEPTLGLDPEERLRFRCIISRISEDKTVIISTHMVEDVATICDHVIIMDKGEVLVTQTVAEIKNNAKGKVFCCTKSKLEEETISYFVEQEFKKEGEIYCRFLSNEYEALDSMEPTVEEGYLCIIKSL